MRRQTAIISAFGLVLGAAILLGSGADARPRKLLWVPRQVRSETFTVSGEFTGQVEGTIVLNGEVCWLAPDVAVYEMGRIGPLPPGTFLNARRVTVSGVVRDGSRIVQHVIIRPPGGDAMYTTGESKNVGVLDERAPQ